MSRCVRCGGNHAADECPTNANRSTRKCVNCGGNHSAAYGGCPAYLQAVDINKMRRQNNISYAQAVQKFGQDHTLVTPLSLAPSVAPVAAPASIAPPPLQVTDDSHEQIQKMCEEEVNQCLDEINVEKVIRDNITSALEVTDFYQEAISISLAITRSILLGYSSKQLANNFQDVIYDFFPETPARDWARQVVPMYIDLVNSFTEKMVNRKEGPANPPFVQAMRAGSQTPKSQTDSHS